jgi:hypothetical protein
MVRHNTTNATTGLELPVSVRGASYLFAVFKPRLLQTDGDKQNLGFV